MIKYLISLFLICLLHWSEPLQANEPPIKVALVNITDSTATHIYGNRWYSTSFEKDIFNYGYESYLGLSEILGAANIDVVIRDFPSSINRKSLFNIVDKPGKAMQQWFDALAQEVDFVVIITKKFEPENKISHRYLNGRQYGIGTYAKYPDVISIFSFVGYYIFDVKTKQEIHLNRKNDEYLLMDIRLDERMSYHELKDLPEQYLNLTSDKLQQIINMHNLEIKRTLLEYLNLK
jgi:hypothetical protein